MLLYINSGHFDILQGLLYSGLVSLHGKPFVYDYPRATYFHEKVFTGMQTEVPDPPGSRPFPPGTRTHHVWHPYGNMGYMPTPDPHGERRFDKTAELLKQGKFKAIILANMSDASAQAMLSLMLVVFGRKRPNIPVIYIDGTDFIPTMYDNHYWDLYMGVSGQSALLREELLVRYPPDLMFKREMNQPEYDHKPVKIVSLTFCAKTGLYPLFPELELRYRPIEATFRGYQTTDERYLLDEYWKIRYGRSIRQFIPNYLDELSLARIGVTAHGTGWDSQRFFEIPMCGAVLMAQRPWIYYDNPPEHGKHCYYFDPD